MPLGLSLSEWKTVVDIASAVVTIGAILIGGWWAYTRFVRERTRWPKANLELVLTHRELTSEKILLNATVKVENTGVGRMVLGELRCDVYQVLPLRQGADLAQLVAVDKPEANWPNLDFKKWSWQKTPPEIEPSEHDQFGFDFVIAKPMHTVFVYAQLENKEKTKTGKTLVWAVSAFYDLGSESGQQHTSSVPAEER